MSKDIKKIKTKIKQANWKSKSIFGDKYMNIVTNIYWQNDDTFIDTDSKFLFQIICENFFSQNKNVALNIKLKNSIGVMFPEIYRIYVYNLTYKKLTGKKIKDDITKIKKLDENSYIMMKLTSQMKTHQKRVLKIIKHLNIDLKKESDRHHRILFSNKKKKDFYISDGYLGL